MPEGLTRVRIKEVGHWRLARNTVIFALVLALVQWPMRRAVEAGDPMSAVALGAGDIAACVVPARMSLLVDVLFVYAYVLAAWRIRRYLAVRRVEETLVGVLGFAGAGLLAVAGVLDLVENAVLWQRFGSAPQAAAGGCASLDVVVVTPVLKAAWVVGFVVLAVALVLAGNAVHDRPRISSFRAAADRWATGRRRTPPLTSDAGTGPFDELRLGRSDADGTVICCSGGGIRSAAFSLGALQRLGEHGIYQKASSVIGVSGGGYIAAAFHVLRRSLRGEPGERPPFAPGTPELARLRRQTRYLLPSIGVSARGIMSLVYGVVINLVLIGIALRLVAWVFGWAIAEAGVIEGWDTSDVRVDFGAAPAWYWIAALGLLAVVVGIFLAEVVVDRFRVPPRLLRTEGRMIASQLTLPGLAAPALLFGVPWLLVLGNAASHGEAGADGTIGDLVGGLGALLDPQVDVVALGGLTGLGAALIALARSAWKGVGGADGTGSRIWTRLLSWARVRLVPWTGTALLFVVGMVVLLRWIAACTLSAGWRSQWWVAGLCAGLFLAVKVLTDATRSSIHPYYRERLSSAYLMRRVDSVPAEDAVTYDYAEPMRYSEAGAANDGGPQLVIVAAANAFDAELVPVDRNCVPFVFDPYLTGTVGDQTLPVGGLVRTAAYERRADYRGRDVTVPAAIAISGAAFSPLTGRENARTRPLRFLFAVVNARLGVWLPNPYWGTSSAWATFADRRRAAASLPGAGRLAGPLARAAGLWAYLMSLADKPGAYRLLKEAVGRTSLYDKRLYVTDGGHYDNLGLVEALRRRPKTVIVIDASNDLEDSFAAVGSAVATARMDLGVDVELDPRPLRRGSAIRAERAWTRGRAVYPDGATAEVLLLKTVLSGNPAWDVETYAAAHPDFPRRSTGDQLYGEFDFEAYRALGYDLAGDLVEDLERRQYGKVRPEPADGDGKADEPVIMKDRSPAGGPDPS